LLRPAKIDIIKDIPLEVQGKYISIRMKIVELTATRPFSFKSRRTGSTTLPAKADASFFKFKNFANLIRIILLSV